MTNSDQLSMVSASCLLQDNVKKLELKMRFHCAVMIILFFLQACLFTHCHRQFTEPNDKTGIMTDIDGNVYETVKIGTQVWMAENLKVTHYRNGDAIPDVTDSLIWQILTIGACCVYDNSEENVPVYGYLYNWYTVSDSRNITPAGWHVPTDAEWETLVDYLGGTSSAGGKLKETGEDHWNSPNTGAVNEGGFTALPGGFRSVDGDFYSMGNYAYFWSLSESDDYAWCLALCCDYSRIQRAGYSKLGGFSVRLVRD
jgi:uncharacterized protein (TIGR02145 family)